jgi:hypothetical protein
VKYYVDATLGNDTQSGTTVASPWKTLGRLGFDLKPGDRVLLKRGETWRETLTVPSSGSEHGTIIYSPYGTGTPPVISAVPDMALEPEETGDIFASGFEDETDALTTDFTGKNTAGGNTVTITDSPVRTGSKALKVSFAGTSVVANAFKTLSSPATVVFVRCWLYVDQNFSMSAAGQQVYLLSMFDNVKAKYPFLIGLNSTGRKEYPFLYGAFQHSTGFEFIPTVVVTPGVFHRLELSWNRSVRFGGVRVRWNGVLLDAATGPWDTSDFDARQLFIGGYVGNHAPAAGTIIYFDDVKLETHGPIGDGVTRRDHCIDLNSQSHISIEGIDLQNASAEAVDLVGATDIVVGSVRSFHTYPWTAPNDDSPPVPIRKFYSISAAFGGAAIKNNGHIFLLDATSKVKRSVDGGGTWNTVLTFPDINKTGSVIFVDSQGFIHACPNGGGCTSGIWTSTDGGETWDYRHYTPPLAQPGGMWGFDDDGEGRRFAAYYHSNATARAAHIYRSVNGLDWSEVWDGVNEGKNARHVHGLACDHATGFIYATVGDGGTYESPITIQSRDHGATWRRILNSMPQCVGVACGAGFRLFGADVPGSRASIYRTTDDISYQEVLSVPPNMDCLWIRIDPDTRHCYAGFGGATASRQPLGLVSGTAGVWKSEDDGLTWSQVLALPITALGDGASYASNIVGGRIVISEVAGGVNIGGGVYGLNQSYSWDAA